ncbi:MAG: neutral zinc metallopeptidase, partial [Cucumibacter sp.]
MKWRGRERSSNIEDRRGAPGGTGRGMGGPGSGMGRIRIPVSGGRGISLGGVLAFAVIVLVVSFFLGVNPLALLTGEVPQSGSGGSVSRPIPEAGEDELVDFVAVVLKETENLWGEVFEQNALTYTAPTLVLYSGRDTSACGLADAGGGPFYCPGDQKIYLDLSFYDELRRQFGAPG